jgi:hypothetical protein
VGVFISRTPNPAPFRAQLTTALQADALSADEAKAKASDLAEGAAAGASSTQFHAARFVGAVVIFAVLLGFAVIADDRHWVSDPSKLYDMATTVLGVIVGFLGGEGAAGAGQ